MLTNKSKIYIIFWCKNISLARQERVCKKNVCCIWNLNVDVFKKQQIHFTNDFTLQRPDPPPPHPPLIHSEGFSEFCPKVMKNCNFKEKGIRSVFFFFGPVLKWFLVISLTIKWNCSFYSHKNTKKKVRIYK